MEIIYRMLWLAVAGREGIVEHLSITPHPTSRPAVDAIRLDTNPL